MQEVRTTRFQRSTRLPELRRCGADKEPLRGTRIRIQIRSDLVRLTAVTHMFQVPRKPEAGAGKRDHCDIGQFACGIVTISQFGIGLFSLGQFTIAGWCVAQFAVAYSLIAQFGIYIHQGHGQFVRRLIEIHGLP